MSWTHSGGSAITTSVKEHAEVDGAFRGVTTKAIAGMSGPASGSWIGTMIIKIRFRAARSNRAKFIC